MRILYLVPYVPNLIRVRPYQLIRHLARRGHAVTVLTLCSSESDQEDARRLAQDVHQVLSASLPRWRSLANCLQALPTRRPLQSAYCWQPELARRALAEARAAAGRGEPYDLLQVEHLRGARFGLWLRERLPGLPVVWDSVDSIARLFSQAAQRSRSPFSRAWTGFELGRTGWYETWLAGQFERTLVTSPADAQALEGAGPPGRVHVLPNGVDLDYFQPGPEAARQPDTLVLSGKMSYHANASMALHFVQEIFPLIQARRPQVQVWIAGKDPGPEIRALAQNPGVRVTGTLSDLRPPLQQAAVAVAPLTYGAGIQNKVLEAMACATPVVCTPRAASALAAVPGRDLLTAEDPQDFAGQVLRLLEDPALRQQTGRAGLTYAHANHDWRVIACQLEGIYLEAVCNQLPLPT